MPWIGQHLDAALEEFRAIGDRPAEARALREAGLLLRDQGDLEGAGHALDTSHEIFTKLGDELWAARLLAGQAALEGLRGTTASRIGPAAANLIT